MIFENSEIDLKKLPTIEEHAFQKLDKSYLKVSYIGNALFFLFLLGAVLIARGELGEGMHPMLFWGVLAFILVWMFIAFGLTKLGYNIRGYVLREKDIVHRRGVIFKNITTIPFNRVQHCEVSQGPIQRFFDLHTLQVFTAGGSNSDLSIPGLKGETAHQIKAFILKKTVIDIEEEEDLLDFY